MNLIFALSGALLLLVHCTSSQENSWSWNEPDSQPQASEQDFVQAPQEQDFRQDEGGEYVESSLPLNNTLTEQVVDEILTSTREGRALEGFQEVYSDPNIQDALQKGDDGEARNIIKDRLCSLGLVQCDEQIQGKRPYIAPEELVYAQPVAINPVGRPIPTIPLKGVRGSGGSYGPPRPVPYPPGSFPPGKYPPLSPPPGKFGPPKPPRRHFGPPPSKPYYGKPDVYETGIGGEYLSKPPPFPNGGSHPTLDSPYQFEYGSSQSAHHKDKRVEIHVNAQGGAASAAGGSTPGSVALEHVHHHYHHNLDGNKSPLTPVAAAAVSSSNSFGSSSSSFGSHPNSLGSSSGLFGSHSGSSSGSFGSSSSFTDNTGGFSPVDTTGLGSFSSGGLSTGVYGGQTLASYGNGGTFGSSKPVVENYSPQTFDSFGASVGSYGSSGLYKKELNVSPVNGNYLQSYADKYQGLESARAENYDCVCVPYDQCPTHDVIGRKDDLYLALDPRSLKSDIEASLDEEERVITDGNGTMTVVRVPKNVNGTEETNEEKPEEKTEEAEKKVSKREAKNAGKKNDAGSTEGRQRQYGTYPTVGTGIYDMVKTIKSTIGVSIGLPVQGGGGYPINPVNPTNPQPLQDPYGGGIVGSAGINLGLVSVNPLISLQVTKDNLGNREIRPFVNFHLTPNNYLRDSVEGLLGNNKKGVVYNKHKHLHIYKGDRRPPHRFGRYEHYAPHYSPYHEIHHYPFVKPHHEEHHYPDFPPPDHYEYPSHHHGHHEYINHGPSHHEYISHGPPNHHEYPTIHGHDHHEYPVSHDHHEYPTSHGHDHHEYPIHSHDHHEYPGHDHHHHPSHEHIEYSPHIHSPHDHYPSYEHPHTYDHDHYDGHYSNSRAHQLNNTDYSAGNSLLRQYQEQYDNGLEQYGSGNYKKSDRGGKSLKDPGDQSKTFKFPSSRRKRDVSRDTDTIEKRQFYGGQSGRPQACGPRHVCCRKPIRPQVPQVNARQCGIRHSQGINGRIKNPVYVDGDSEFGEYPWQVAILKKDPKESVYVCGGTLVDPLHILTAAHCVKTYTGFDLRVRLGEWDVNHDVEFYPYIERDIASVNVHPEFYAGTLYNDIAVLRMDKPVDFAKHPHISPACLPYPRDDYTGTRCWTTGWGKDAFGDFGKYQNILKEVDVPVINNGVCQRQMQQTRLGYDFKLHPGFICAGGEEGKDACKGDGGGPMVCERSGTWQVVGIVSWGIGCGQVGVPGVYVKVAHYLDWIRQVTQRY